MSLSFGTICIISKTYSNFLFLLFLLGNPAVKFLVPEVNFITEFRHNFSSTFLTFRFGAVSGRAALVGADLVPTVRMAEDLFFIVLFISLPFVAYAFPAKCFFILLAFLAGTSRYRALGFLTFRIYTILVTFPNGLQILFSWN